MNFLHGAVRHFGIAGELVEFFWGNKRWWLLPMVVVLLVFAVMLILAQSSAIGQFVYTFF